MTRMLTSFHLVFDLVTYCLTTSHLWSNLIQILSRQLYWASLRTIGSKV